jgi:hypothetical protein
VPRLIDTRTRTGTLVDAIGSLLHHFESRERILCVAAHQTGASLLAEIESGQIWHGVPAFLPGDDDTHLLTRAWLGWCELWRTESSLAEIVGEIRRQELAMLAEAHEHRLSRPDLDVLAAVLDGLRQAVCAPVRPMERLRARELLAGVSAAALDRSA